MTITFVYCARKKNIGSRCMEGVLRCASGPFTQRVGSRIFDVLSRNEWEITYITGAFACVLVCVGSRFLMFHASRMCI